jgi:hypothetical protein
VNDVRWNNNRQTRRTEVIFLKLSEIMTEFELENLNNKPIDENTPIDFGYVSDLMSQVLGSAKSNSIWMTVQSHLNIVGVGAMTGISAIVICEGHEVTDNVVAKADEEKIALFRSKENAFHLAGKLYAKGLR